MSGSAISWKRIKRLNREHGERFVHAWTYNTPPYVWVCLRHDATAAEFDPSTGDLTPTETRETTTVSLLRGRAGQARDAEWLIELDRRQVEIEAASTTKVGDAGTG